MKKNNQMKPDNVAKRLWAFFIVLTMCITVQPVVPVKAQEAVQTAASTIYTDFKDGNSTHSGDGSYGNPYNLFEDAYAAAGNGDEISILGSGAFLNAEAAEPFIFDKSVTVNGNGNTFSNRKGDLSTLRCGFPIVCTMQFLQMGINLFLRMLCATADSAM